MDLEYEIFEKIQLSLIQYLSKISIEDISREAIKSNILKNIPEDRDINDYIIDKMIIGFANNYFPEFQILSDDIKTNMALAMTKENYRTMD